jgi:acetylornithine deacetylase/succinyl-diaminopimelate desuccinylase-like protein
MEELLERVDTEWIASRTEELVRVHSVTMAEVEVCRMYEQMMRDVGLTVDVREVTPGRNNLYARIPGNGTGPALMLNGHLDTIPIGHCPACSRDGNRIYGRGTTDMKGGMAAALGAIKALAEAGVELAGDLWLTAVVGHEEPEAQKDGPLALIEDCNSGRVGGDRILIVEGRDALWVMSMGSMVFTIRLESDMGGRHTQYVPFADNPIRHTGDLIQRIQQFQTELDAGQVHPLAGPERIDLGIVSAGDYFNRTPLHCVLTGTRRWSPGRDAEQILAELEALAAPIAKAGGLRLQVTMEHEREPFETPADDPAVQAVAGAHTRVTGTDADYVGLRIVGDANLYVHGAGVPTFYYGPSNETAHADLEWVEVDRLQRAAQVYALAAIDYCGVADPG